jgi:alpha-L-rhamnosidase
MKARHLFTPRGFGAKPRFARISSVTRPGSFAADNSNTKATANRLGAPLLAFMLAGFWCISALSLPIRSLAKTDVSASDLFQASDWTAQWIGRNNPPTVPKLGQQAPAPLLRKEFTLEHSIAKATLRICGLGFYEAFINGHRVGDQVLDPPPTVYNQTALYATFDVSDLLQAGANAIGVTLGRGYFAATADDGFNLGSAPWRNEPRLLLQLDITYRNGQTIRIVSDGSWQMADGPILDSLTFGENYDARLEQTGWTLPGFNAASWIASPVQPSPTKKVLPRAMEPIKIVDTLAPVAVSTPQPGVTVYDFALTTAGWERILTRGSRGTIITLVLGETLNSDGTAYQLAPQEHQDTYTLSGNGNETWEPQFMRHGFRYIQVSYSPAAPSAFQIEARINHTAVRSTGQFVSSNDVLNRVHQNQRATVLNNLWGFPTDTPWRDRQGWTADAHLYMTSAIENFGMKRFYDQWMRSYRESSQSDGGLPVIIPYANAFPLFTDPSWSGTLIFDTWQLYQDYGDLQVVKDNYDAMSRWMDLLATTIAATGNVYTGFTFTDWAAPGHRAQRHPAPPA